MTDSGVTTASPIVVVVRNALRRAGLGRMLRSIDGIGPYRLTDGMAQAIVVAGSITSITSVILIVVLSELTETDIALLTSLGSSVRIITMVGGGEQRRLGGLAGRSIGLLPLADLDTRTLGDAVRRADRGEHSMPHGPASQLLTTGQAADRATTVPRLTPREQQTARLLVDGLTNKQIGNRLDISEHGAKRLVANIMAKLDCPNRTLAVAKLLRDRAPEPAAQQWAVAR